MEVQQTVAGLMTDVAHDQEGHRSSDSQTNSERISNCNATLGIKSKKKTVFEIKNS
jgi:hypothetical protein